MNHTHPARHLDYRLELQTGLAQVASSEKHVGLPLASLSEPGQRAGRILECRCTLEQRVVWASRKIGKVGDVRERRGEQRRIACVLGSLERLPGGGLARRGVEVLEVGVVRATNEEQVRTRASSPACSNASSRKAAAATTSCSR